MKTLKPYFDGSVVAYFNMRYSALEDEEWADTDNAFAGFVIGFEQAVDYIEKSKENISEFYLQIFHGIRKKNKSKILSLFGISEKE